MLLIIVSFKGSLLRNLYIFLLLLSLTAYGKSSWTDWDGKYEHIDCGDAEQCAQVAGQLNVQGRHKEAMPFMASSCMKGRVGFCWLVGYSSSAPKFADNGYKFFKQGCILANKMGNECRAAIQHLLAEEDIAEAKRVYKQLCNDTSDLNCVFSIKPHVKSSASKKKAFENGKKMVAESCKEGHSTSCNLQTLYP